MKDLPIIEPKEVITTITNMKTGEQYKDDNEWKSKGALQISGVFSKSCYVCIYYLLLGWCAMFFWYTIW